MVIDWFLFIVLCIVIGYLVLNLMDIGKVYGVVLGDDEVVVVKKIVGFDLDKMF